jgi:hypothetical protein
MTQLCTGGTGSHPSERKNVQSIATRQVHPREIVGARTKLILSRASRKVVRGILKSIKYTTFALLKVLQTQIVQLGDRSRLRPLPSITTKFLRILQTGRRNTGKFKATESTCVIDKQSGNIPIPHQRCSYSYSCRASCGRGVDFDSLPALCAGWFTLLSCCRL